MLFFLRTRWMLAGGAWAFAVSMAGAQQYAPLPPVHLLPPTAAVSAPAVQPTAPAPAPQADAVVTPGASAPAKVIFTQPQPGAYAQPSVATQPALTANAPVVAAAPVASAPRKISLGFAPAAAPVEAAPVSAPDRTTMPAAGISRENARVDRVAPTMVSRQKAVARKKEPPKPPALIVKPGKPLLDEFGVQRVDPEGKLMFEPPVKQMRDKRGMPMFDAKKQPVFQTADDLGYDEHGKRIRAEKVETPKPTVVTIERGAFTVDGIVGKVQLNYDVGELKYFYLYVPDTGVTVVSDKPFPGATEQRGAFRGNVLTVKTEEHTLQVSSERPFFGKKPVSAYVMVDRGFLMTGAKFPVFGYGATTVAPYEWPGSKAEEKLAGVADYAPPVPKELKPKLITETPAVAAPGAPVAVVAPAGEVSPNAGTAVAPVVGGRGCTSRFRSGDCC